MEQFNFEITLNYCLNICTIKPPNSYTALLEIITQKFAVSNLDKLVYFNEEEELRISNESDYYKLFDHADKNSLKDIEIIIKSEQDKSNRKKSTRKKSKHAIPSTKSKHLGQEDCLNGKNGLFRSH
jgi:hypothetical protein